MRKLEVAPIRPQAHATTKAGKHAPTRLLGLLALCPDCHRVKHFGLAQAKGEQERAGRWLMRVNGWMRKQAYDYAQEAFRLWEKHSA